MESRTTGLAIRKSSGRICAVSHTPPARWAGRVGPLRRPVHDALRCINCTKLDAPHFLPRLHILLPGTPFRAAVRRRACRCYAAADPFQSARRSGLPTRPRLRRALGPPPRALSSRLISWGIADGRALTVLSTTPPPCHSGCGRRGADGRLETFPASRAPDAAQGQVISGWTSSASTERGRAPVTSPWNGAGPGRLRPRANLYDEAARTRCSSTEATAGSLSRRHSGTPAHLQQTIWASPQPEATPPRACVGGCATTGILRGSWCGAQVTRQMNRRRVSASSWSLAQNLPQATQGAQAARGFHAARSPSAATGCGCSTGACWSWSSMRMQMSDSLANHGRGMALPQGP